MQKKLSFLFFLIIPLVFLIIGLKFDRTKYGTDPESAYLINGLNIAMGKPVGHYDNPGTTVQLFSALVLRITHLLRFTTDDIQTDVLSNPELYIETLRKSLIVMNALIFLLLGIITYILLGNAWAGIVLQLAPFLSTTLVEQFYTKVAPEPLLFASTSLLILLLFKHYKSLTPTNIKYPIVFGTLAGFGLVTKMTFLPALVIPFIVLEGKKNKLVYILTIIPSFILFTLPAAKGYLNMAHWFLNLGTHTGTYGQGNAGIIDPQQYISALQSIVKNNKAMIAIMCCGILVLSYSWISSTKLKDKSLLKEQRILFGVLLCQIGSVFMVAKHYHSNHYFFPSLSLMGLIVITMYLLMRKKIEFKKAIYSKIALPIVAAVILIVSLLNIPFLTLAYNGYRTSNASTDETMALLENKYKDYTKVYYFPTSFNVYSSNRWGNVYARQLHNAKLMELYPEGLFYNVTEKSFQFWETNISTREFVKKYGGNILLVGGPRTYDEIKAVEQGGLKLKKLFEGRVQVIYQIDTANSPLFKELKIDGKPTFSMENNFEKLSSDAQWFIDKNQNRFCKSNILSTEKKRSGKNSILLPNTDSYGMEYHSEKVKPGDIFELSIWLNGPNQDIYLCAVGEQSSEFYKQSKGFVETDKNGWKKMSLSFAIPADFKGNTIKIYLWNHSSTAAWFDDFQINKY